MSQITTGRGKWLTWEPLTKFDGSKATKPSYAEWATGTAYAINDTVKLTSGATITYHKCRVTHTSAAADKTGTAPDEKLNAQRWREIPQYTVLSLRSAVLTHGTSQETAVDLSEDQDPKISTELTGSVNLVFNMLEDDKVQETFDAGTHGICTIYPFGIGAGKKFRQFNADVQSEGMDIGPGALNSPVVLDMDGPLTKGTQA